MDMDMDYVQYFLLDISNGTGHAYDCIIMVFK